MTRRSGSKTPGNSSVPCRVGGNRRLPRCGSCIAGDFSALTPPSLYLQKRTKSHSSDSEGVYSVGQASERDAAGFCRWETWVAGGVLVVVWGGAAYFGYLLWDKVEPERRWSLGWFLVPSPVCLWDSGEFSGQAPRTPSLSTTRVSNRKVKSPLEMKEIDFYRLYLY